MREDKMTKIEEENNEDDDDEELGLESKPVISNLRQLPIDYPSVCLNMCIESSLQTYEQDDEQEPLISVGEEKISIQTYVILLSAHIIVKEAIYSNPAKILTRIASSLHINLLTTEELVLITNEI